MRPSEPEGNPLPETRLQVSPPSVDFHSPLPGPPPFMQHAVRRRWYVAAKILRGSPGDVDRSVAPVSSSTLSTCFHVRPPSVVLKMPRSPPDPNSGPCAATTTTSLLFGSMRILAMCFDSPSPMNWNVLPPSVDL